jgi:sodium transport system permease protein
MLSIIAFSVAGHFMPTERIGMVLTIGLRFLFSALFVMLPLAMLLASLQTMVAAFARSYREAQTYLSLLMFVPVIPTLMLSIMPVKAKLWMYAVPLMGQQVAITRLLRGDFVPFEALFLSFGCTAAAALVVYIVTSRIYHNERLAISA